MATNCKKQRLALGSESSSLKDIFTEFPETLVKEIAGRMDEFSDKSRYYSLTLNPLRILNCNAADIYEGVHFSQSYCCVEMEQELHWFGGIFMKGIDLLKTFMLTRKAPTSTKEKLALMRLLLFLQELMKDNDAQSTLENLEMFSDAELTVVMANHLFAKLSVSQYTTIDKLCKGNSQCPCDVETCKPIAHFGDTSIGSPHVWNGNLDILVNYEVPIVVGLHSEENCDRSGGKLSAGIQPRRNDLLKNHQNMAKAIVFSFLQKLRHPEYEHFLCPCICVTAKDLIVVFYDSKNDILLESSIVPLISQRVTSVGKVNMAAILTAWLVVNYNCLCDGLTNELETSAKTGFFRHAAAKMNIYENYLQIGDVKNQDHKLECITPVQIVPNLALHERYKDDIFTKISEGAVAKKTYQM
ncbi:uncharacterized protein [Argopecten irradians]|uniref:uncharacterized protein n=1 Tax=Argopecten irradians TaxID=31199 RepID=UPI00371910D4